MFFESALPWIYILLHIIVFWSWNKYPRHASALRKMCQKKQEHMIGITYGMLPSRTIAVSTLGQKKADASWRRNKIPVYNWRLIWKVTPFTFWLCHYVWYLWYPFKFRVFSCIPMRIFYLYYYTFLICRYVAPSLEYIYPFPVLDLSTFCWPRLCFPGNAFSRCQTDVNRGVLQLDLFSQKSLPFDFLKGNCWWKKPCTTWHV